MVDEAVPLGARRARAGDDRPGRHLLRAAHDPGDGRARRDDRRARAAARWLINFTNPAGHGHRGASSRCSATARSASATRRPGCAGASPRALGPRPERAVVRLLRPQPPRLAAAASATPAATCCPELLADDERARRLRGGPAVRRRVAAHARDDPERVPLLLLLRARTRSTRSARSPTPRGAFLLEQQRAFYAQQRPGAGGGAGRLARDPPRPRAHLHGRGAQRRRASTAEHDDGGDGGGYEGEAMAVVEAIANNTPRGADPQHRQPLARCRSWTSARSSRCRASSAAPARCRSRSATCPPTRGRSSSR